MREGVVRMIKLVIRKNGFCGLYDNENNIISNHPFRAWYQCWFYIKNNS